MRVSKFSVENFWSQIAENFRRGIYFRVSVNSIIKKNYASEGFATTSDFLSKIFCLTVPKTSVGGILFCFNNSGYRKSLGRSGQYQFFPSKFLCLTVPKISIGGEPFSVSLVSAIEKVCVRGGEYQKFPSKVIFLTVSKNFLEEPFRVSLISGTEKVSPSEGYATTFDFLSKTFCRTVPKCFVGEPFCAVFQKLSGSEKNYG